MGEAFREMNARDEERWRGERKIEAAQTNMLAVHKTATTRIFSHKHSFSPLPACSLFSHSVSSRRGSARLHGSSCGKLPVSRVCRITPSLLTLHHENRVSHQGDPNKAFLQSKELISWTPQTSEQARLDS